MPAYNVLQCTTSKKIILVLYFVNIKSDSGFKSGCWNRSQEAT